LVALLGRAGAQVVAPSPVRAPPPVQTGGPEPDVDADPAAARERRRATRRERRRPAGPAPLGLSVLVVDDSRASREVVARAYERCGFAVTKASDGVEALEALRAARDAPPPGGRFCAVVIDSQMPRMSGPEALAAAAADPGIDAPPAVGLSGSPDDVARGGAFEKAGAIASFCKPVTQAELVRGVCMCVEAGGAALPPALAAALARLEGRG